MDAAAVRISVIVPVRADPRLRSCLESLGRQSFAAGSYEVIVVDDASDVATRALARAAGVRYISQRGGAYAARAAGTADARAAVLAFTDADAVVPPNWLAEIDTLFRDATCEAVTGPSSSASDNAIARWVQDVDDGRWERLRGVDDHAVVETRNFAIRRELLARVPFDPAFRQAGDLDLGIRLQRAGVRVRVIEALRVAHEHPESLRVLVAREIRRGRGLARLERKHGTHRPPQGDRPLRVAGFDLKALLLGLARRPVLRWIPAAGAAFAIVTLAPVTSVLARVPAAYGLGRRTFIALERASLLLGRTRGP